MFQFSCSCQLGAVRMGTTQNTKATRVWTGVTNACSYQFSFMISPWEQLHMLFLREVLRLVSMDDSPHLPVGDLDVLQHHLAGVLGRVVPVQHHIQHYSA